MSDVVNAEDLLVWVDMENFGLRAASDPPIELGICITGPDLEPLAQNSWVIWDKAHEVRYHQMHQIEMSDSDKFVKQMHTDNRLFDTAIKHGNDLEDVENLALDFLQDHLGLGLPMCGSSIQFDRQVFQHWMPKFNDAFHYRNIDVSTVKELCRRYNPRVYAAVPEVDTKTHRVDTCLKGTMTEFRHYRDEFLLW